jgi:hypothetical protein
MTKFDWSKTSIVSFDPGRVVDVGDYGVLPDDKAGRKGNLVIRKKRNSKKPKPTAKLSPGIDLAVRAFPEALDGRAASSHNKAIQKPSEPEDAEWSADDRQVLLLLWRGGISAGRIGSLLGKSKNAVKNKAKKLGVKRPN